MGNTTPMMRQYQEIKNQYPDCLLFFRLGDFYELFAEDARIAAQELEIVLTSREAGKNNRIPMCGVPYHAADVYIKRLLEKGYKIAICEQLEEAKPGKGIVKRDVVRVLTPGTILDYTFLDQSKNNFILSLSLKNKTLGCAWSDITTGKFWIAQFRGGREVSYFYDLIQRLQPAECILRSSQVADFQALDSRPWQEAGVRFTYYEPKITRKEAIELVNVQFNSLNSISFQVDEFEEALMAAALLLRYLQETQKTEKLPFKNLLIYTPDSGMYLDAMTRKNLELFATLREGRKEGSLFWALDRTSTAMGARMLRSWLESPLTDLSLIEERLAATEELVNNFFLHTELKECFQDVYDLERLSSRIDWQVAHPRDLLALAHSLSVIPRIKDLLSQTDNDHLRSLGERLDPLSETKDLIFRAIAEDPPVNLKDGGIIKRGFDQRVDELRDILQEGDQWIRQLEQEERNRTGIKSLKIGYNKVFGYYIEVTKPNLHLVPENYIRKQTLTQAERFITPELKEKESLLFGAKEKLQEIEYQLFLEIRQEIAKVSEKIRENAEIIARLDCFSSFAEVAREYHYTRPRVNKSGIIKIKSGRHPVLEQLMEKGEFVPNDISIGEKNNRIHILTGPNMAGKSTYMRQVALLVLMAQCGSFIPAESAEISIVDRIFVRAGAMDDLTRGQSTFMMEMSEVSYILQQATSESLIVLDEIGRGTGTFDGLSIAWAIVEYIHNHIGAKVLFATHYHQLNQLAEKFEGVANYSIAVEEKGREIIFLRKVVPGGTDKSYGIHVARLANLPERLVQRAEEILNYLEQEASGIKRIKGDSDNKSNKSAFVQPVLFEEKNPILKELENLDLVQVTPLEALNILFDWQQRLKKRPARRRKKY
ncbi:MAG: DNA mismatch repair protein MutS [Thermoanaerobacterales bacterium 50_218]|nr:MAG: DNA mismatch repair protein MutS [Thermoanaerobacterales bacterium 50_218]